MTSVADQGQLELASPAPKMTTFDLDDLLHAHFIRPEDRLASAGAGAVYLTEVTAPGGSGRRADAVHIGLWQSRGAGRIDVCELKTSRSDFRRELDQPAKAEAWWPYSSAFWIVAPSTDIAPPEELPPGWGLMVPKANSRRFRVVVKPAEREPKLTIGLLLTLLKNTETTRVNALQRQAQSMHSEHRAEMDKLRRDRSVSQADPKVKRRLELLDQLEAVMGMRLDDTAWRDSDVTPLQAGGALKRFMRGEAARLETEERMRYRAAELDRIAVEAAKHAKELREAIAEPPTIQEAP
jgi:hypothetical protein